MNNRTYDFIDFERCLFRFRLKYHPDESAKRKAEQKENVHRRLEIFQELQEKGRFNNLHIEFESAVDIIHIMDTCERFFLVFKFHTFILCLLLLLW